MPFEISTTHVIYSNHIKKRLLLKPKSNLDVTSTKKSELVLSLPTRVLPVVRLSSVFFHGQAVHVCRQVCIILQSITPRGCHLQSLLLSQEKKTSRCEQIKPIASNTPMHIIHS